VVTVTVMFPSEYDVSVVCADEDADDEDDDDEDDDDEEDDELAPEDEALLDSVFVWAAELPEAVAYERGMTKVSSSTKAVNATRIMP
jgi:hypothetical protein